MFNDSHWRQSEVDGAQADSPAAGPRDTRVPAPQFSRLALCVTAAAALTLGVVGTVAYSGWFNHDQQAYAEAIANARQTLGRPAASNSVPVKQVVAARAGLSAVLAAPSATGAARTSPDSGDQPQQSQQSQRSQRSQQDQPVEEGSRQTVWSGQVARAPAAAMQPAGRGDSEIATPAAATTASASTAPSLHSNRRATGSTDAGAPQSASSRTVKDPRAGPQDRRNTAADARQSAQQSARQLARQNAQHQSTLFARMGLFFRRVSYRQHGNANQQQPDLYSHP